MIYHSVSNALLAIYRSSEIRTMSAGALGQTYGKPLFSSGKWVGFINGNYAGA